MGKWIVKGGGETNPVNNQHSRIKNSEAVPDPTSADAENTVQLDMGSKNPVLAKLHTGGFNLDNRKFYPNSYATYHNFFVKEFLDRVSLGKTVRNASCNAGTVTTNIRGCCGEFKVWLSERGIANLLYTTMLEYSGHIVSTAKNRDCIVVTPKGKKIVFKRDKEYARVCNTLIWASTSKESA